MLTVFSSSDFAAFFVFFLSVPLSTAVLREDFLTLSVWVIFYYHFFCLPILLHHTVFLCVVVDDPLVWRLGHTVHMGFLSSGKRFRFLVVHVSILFAVTDLLYNVCPQNWSPCHIHDHHFFFPSHLPSPTSCFQDWYVRLSPFPFLGGLPIRHTKPQIILFFIVKR